MRRRRRPAVRTGCASRRSRVARPEEAGKNRLHLDLVVADLEEATQQVEQLGGRSLEPGTTRELEGFTWRCMADPKGNEFGVDVLPPA
jgi:predicted enzyme related to lactoylglutathione lyase